MDMAADRRFRTSRMIETTKRSDIAAFTDRTGSVVVSQLVITPGSIATAREDDAEPDPAAILLRLVAAILDQHARPGDLILRGTGLSFLIWFKNHGEQASAFRASLLVRELRRELGRHTTLGQTAISTTTMGCRLADGGGPGEEAIILAIERLFDTAAPAEAIVARTRFAAALDAARLHTEWLRGATNASVPIAYVRIQPELARSLAVSLAALPEAEHEAAALDTLYLRLAEEATGSDIASGLNRAYLVPVDFAVFRSRLRLETLLQACQGLASQTISRLIFMVGQIPATTSRAHRQKAVEQLLPFCKGFGVELDSVGIEHLDFGKNRLPLVACPADVLIAAWRRQDTKLDLLLDFGRRRKIKLIATEVDVTQERTIATDLQVDLLESASERRPAENEPPLVLLNQPATGSDASALAFEHAAAGLFLIEIGDHHQVLSQTNRFFRQTTGYSTEEIKGRHWSCLIGPATEPHAVDRINASLAKGVSVDCELLAYRRDGSPFWSNWSLKPVRDATGLVISYVGTLSDASQFVRSAAQHHALEALFMTVADAIPGYIYQRLVRDGQSSYPYMSASFARLIGLPDGTRITSEILDRHFHPDDAAMVARALSQADLAMTDHRLEFRLVRTDGAVVWVRSLSRARVSSPGEVMWTGVAVDISGEKSVEENLSHLHMHDALTGLLNRPAFQRSIHDLVCAAQTNRTDCAVLDIDLVSFDEINDVFGRPVGDKMLQEIAARLNALAGEDGLVARLDGDSFGMVVSDFAGRGAITRLTHAVTQELARPFTVDDQRLKVQSIVGAAILSQIDQTGISDLAQTAEELIKRASVARHEARLSRSNVSAIYAPEIDSRVRKRARLRQSLHRAIDAEEFELYYQPIVHLKTGDICGAEALIRWNEPSLGLQRPDEFIPLAEESGLIIPLGAWALKSAVRELKRWDEPGIVKPRIAVNVSGVQLQERDFVSTVKQIITQGEIAPQQIELELTESFLIHESGRLSDTLQELKDLGITIAIDDFGTGYSSFQYLRELPATKVKIDQSFIRNLNVGSSDASIVRAMITMAVNLGLEIVVEGVETAEQREFLIGEGCVLAQGYLFSVPLKAEDFFWTFESRAILPLQLLPIGGPQTSPSKLLSRPAGLIGLAPA